jgi:hypothetical protein
MRCVFDCVRERKRGWKGRDGASFCSLTHIGLLCVEHGQQHIAQGAEDATRPLCLGPARKAQNGTQHPARGGNARVHGRSTLRLLPVIAICCGGGRKSEIRDRGKTAAQGRICGARCFSDTKVLWDGTGLWGMPCKALGTRAAHSTASSFPGGPPRRKRISRLF